MADTRVADIKAYLVNLSLHATPEWVEGCVEYFISEHTGQMYTAAALRDFVLQQWKLADLRAMGQGCLPPSLSGIIKTVLQGKYALQVEWIRNVGQSAYSQLQEIRKQVNENVNVGATLPQGWEPHPTRMLQLALCDGIQSIKAIEYRPILSLQEQLFPGYKVYVIGPVECRRGVLLLQQHNLEVIGGEIDSLLIPNAIENILARTLNLEINPDPYKSQPTLQQVPVVQRSDIILPPRNNIQSPVVPAALQKPSITNNKTQVSSRNFVGGLEEEFLDEDDLMLGADFDAQLSVLEHKYQDERTSKNNRALTIDELEHQYLADIQSMGLEEMEFELGHNEKTSNIQRSSHSSETEIIEEHNTSNLLDDDDDFLLQMSMEAFKEPKKQMKQQSVQSSYSAIDDMQKQKSEFGKSIGVNHCSTATDYKKPADQCNKAPDYKKPANQCRKVPDYKKPAEKCSKAPDYKKSGDQYNKAPDYKRYTVKSQTRGNNVQSKITSFLNKSLSEIDSSCSVSKYDNCGSNKVSKVDKVMQKKTCLISDNCAKEEHPPAELDSSDAHKSSKKSKIHLSDFVDVTGHQLSVKNEESAASFTLPIVTDRYPFVYISQIKAPVKYRCVFTVKAFVMTLLCQMRLQKDGWNLLVTVCDGSSNLDVRLSSDVLEKIIGYTRAEIVAVNQEIAKNPLLQEKITKILQNAQQKLINLNCLLDIEFLPNSEHPCVINIHEITEHHLRALQARLKYIDINMAQKT